MAALICDVKQYAENLVRWSRLSGLLLLFVFAGVCGAEEMPFKMSSLVLPQGVSYTLGPVTLTRALEQATSANKTGKTSSLQSHETSSTKKTVGSGVESSTSSGHSSGYNFGGSIGGSSGGTGSVSLMGLLGINLGGIGGKVSGEDSSRLKSTNHNGTESTSENSRQSASGSSREFEEQEQYGSYHLRFTVSFKSKDLSDTFLVGGPNASVILNGFSTPVKVPYTERNEAIRLGAEERILFFDYPIADQVTLQDAKRFAATGRRNAVTLSLTGDDFPVVSERTKHNVVSEITRIMQTIPNTVVSLDFGDVKRLSPWRIRRKFARSSGRGGQHVTIREALEALNGVIAKDEEMPEVTFKFAKDGRLEAVGDTPALASPRKDDLTFIAVSVVTDTYEADTEVHFPTKAFLSRPLSDFTDVRFVQLQLSELVQASVKAPETVKTLSEEVKSALPSVDGAEKLWCIKSALVAFEAEDYNKGWELSVDIQDSDPRIQFYVAECYCKGLGGASSNEQKAVCWYRKSAEQGYADAQGFLGDMYYDGRGVAKDDVEAVRWFRKAAGQGSARGQNALGCMYFEGRGVEEDHAEAVRWVRKAAEQGLAYAQCNLGDMYSGGRGVEKDDVEAVRWFRKAAEQGNASAQAKLGLRYADGRGVEIDDSEAVRWFRKAAEQGDASAQRNLGNMYLEGLGVEKNDAEALRWFRRGAEQGDADAQGGLGYMYLAGRGVVMDAAEAVLWFRKAAEQGHVQAQYVLGEVYSTGIGVTKDDTEAVRWYRKAAKQGYADAQQVLRERGLSWQATQ